MGKGRLPPVVGPVVPSLRGWGRVSVILPIGLFPPAALLLLPAAFPLPELVLLFLPAALLLPALALLLLSAVLGFPALTLLLAAVFLFLT